MEMMNLQARILRSASLFLARVAALVGAEVGLSVAVVAVFESVLKLLTAGLGVEFVARKINRQKSSISAILTL